MSTHPVYPRLFEPIEIGPVELRNRVAISAHFAGWWVTDGLPNEDFAAYIEERAKGGIGLFVIGATGPTYAAAPDWMQNTSDDIIPRYRMLAEAGHRHGTKVFAQLIHTSDHMARPGPERIREGMRAQVVPHSRRRPTQPERTPAELRELAAAFGAAAGRAVEGGIDGLELHAHEGFLHAQFLSPRVNRRTDEYGGSLEGRARFVVETLEAMRDAIGSDVPLGVRLKADDQEPTGMAVEEYVDLVTRIESLGLVDYLSLTAGDGGLHHGPMTRPDGEWLPFVAQVKEATSLPIMHAGRITTPEMAEQALTDGALDIVCMTKAHIADPHFTRKARDGERDRIRLCARCLQSCIGAMEHMSCVYNPVTSREREWADLKPAGTRKTVVIIGAGPAGMEAAITAHARGHEVTVLEASDRVGGQVHAAASSPMRAMFARVAEFYQREADRGDFTVTYGVRATADSVAALQPNAVVVATGSVERRGAAPGDGPIRTVGEMLAADVTPGTSVLVVDRSGAMNALGLVDYLSHSGARAQYVTPAGRTCHAVEGMTREDMLRKLSERDVQWETQQTLAWWDGEVAVLRHAVYAEERELRDIDTVVIAAGALPVNDLSNVLRGRVPELHTIGDANVPRTVHEATLQGGLVGRTL
ncbi:FAD-dependent oxidoreductase [Candidatus Poribacteria bacterium]|nr:FAD-dependent oxidoreductase [Candidatus Poribacteria bacterium]MBT5534022.1 FAD-dependent oxidoreductase [Candidatus Poribacteria bacterium]MBT5709685.1 FAD-dependent oxidoreductase [Candidatus Poribacteria bacterium]MBT7804708.1 FAD-dependent oxidoreductase [Candidatus Poribacteria bacterium]